MSDVHISVVIPIYCCYECIESLYDRLGETLSKLTDKFEIIMVNDASPDDAWNNIKHLAYTDSRVKGISLSKNFGQHYAITAGLDYAKGDWVVVMDGDLQDQPEEILKLYKKAQEGYDVVFGKRKHRQDSIIRKLSSYLFYKVYDYFTESKIDSSVANFSIISAKVVFYIRQLKEKNRCYPIFVNWLGFKRANIEIEHCQRGAGKSSYTTYKLINLAINNIVSQSNKPLRLSIMFGFSISLISLLYAAWLMARYFLYFVPVDGWTSVMVSLYFIGGLFFFNMGFLGLYIGKIFDETKNRPLYVVKESTFNGVS